MARNRKTPVGNIPGHPSTWVGKPFRWHPDKSGGVVEVTAYERGSGGRFVVVYVYRESPTAPELIDQVRSSDPDFFRQRFAPYDPNEPVVEPFDITKALTGQRPDARVIPIRPRKDTH